MNVLTQLLIWSAVMALSGTAAIVVSLVAPT